MLYQLHLYTNAPDSKRRASVRAFCWFGRRIKNRLWPPTRVLHSCALHETLPAAEGGTGWTRWRTFTRWPVSLKQNTNSMKRYRLFCTQCRTKFKWHDIMSRFFHCFFFCVCFFLSKVYITAHYMLKLHRCKPLSIWSCIDHKINI